jgi:hypothetical protein
VGPDLLVHHLGRVAPQDVQLHRGLDRANIDLRLPAILPPKPRGSILPSALLLWGLVLRACCGGLGIHMTRVRSATRSARTSAGGLIACTAALTLAWLLYVRA